MVGPQFFAELVSDPFSLHSLIIFLGCVFFPPKLWLISTEEKLQVTVVSQALLRYNGRKKWLKLSSSLFLALQRPNLPCIPQTALGRLVHPTVGPAAASPGEPAGSSCWDTSSVPFHCRNVLIWSSFKAVICRSSSFIVPQALLLT